MHELWLRKLLLEALVSSLNACNTCQTDLFIWGRLGHVRQHAIAMHWLTLAVYWLYTICS